MTRTHQVDLIEIYSEMFRYQVCMGLVTLNLIVLASDVEL